MQTEALRQLQDAKSRAASQHCHFESQRQDVACRARVILDHTAALQVVLLACSAALPLCLSIHAEPLSQSKRCLSPSTLASKQARPTCGVHVISNRRRRKFGRLSSTDSPANESRRKWPTSSKNCHQRIQGPTPSRLRTCAGSSQKPMKTTQQESWRRRSLDESWRRSDRGRCAVLDK